MLHPIKKQINELAQAGDSAKAYELLKKYVAENPHDVEALYQAVIWAFKLMHWELAKAYMEQLLSSPQSSKYYGVAADFYAQVSDLKSAIKYQEKVTKDSDAEALFKLAMLYFKYFDFDMAQRTFSLLLKLVPNNTQILGIIADIEHGNGDFKNAIEKYQRILKIEPTNESAFNGIVKSTKFKDIDAGLIELAETILSADNVNDEQKAQVHLSLGKMHDDCKLYEQAWKHFSKGNAIQSKLYPFDKASLIKQVQEIKNIFDTAFFDEEPSGDAIHSPIFIIGMPRSGTTLLEQVLESTGELCGIGESAGLTKAMNRRFNNIRYPAEANKASRELFGLMANDYVSFVKDSHINGDKRSVDKLPGNFLHLGLLKKMFPNAKFINMTRNKWDCCLSIYFQMFSNSMSFTTDIKHVEYFHGVYTDILDHWNNVFPENIYNLSYENLVNDFKNETKSLFEFLGLDWSEDVSDFVNSKNSVHTPSSWQVRQGINNKAVGRSQHYMKFIG